MTAGPTEVTQVESACAGSRCDDSVRGLPCRSQAFEQFRGAFAGGALGQAIGRTDFRFVASVEATPVASSFH